MEIVQPGKEEAARPRKNWILFWLGVGAAVGLIALAFGFDDAFASLMDRMRSPEAKSAAKFFNTWGDWPRLMLLALVAGSLTLVFRLKAATRVVLVMMLACTLGGVAANVIRVSVGRARPNAKSPEGFYGPVKDGKLVITNRDFHSFPSAHTTCSAAFAAALLLVEWRLGLLLMAGALAVGWARIYSGAHHLSDVVAAVLLGTLCAWWAWRILGRRKRWIIRLMRRRDRLIRRFVGDKGDFALE